MRIFPRLLVAFFILIFLVSCGADPEDKTGRSLKAGERYVMTDQGLEHVPYLTDAEGKKVESGKQYVMTHQGLEYVPYMKDREGKRLELGSEYIMGAKGLDLKVRRNIHGKVVDSSGTPLSDVGVKIMNSEHKTVTETDGSFALPFIEGYVRLIFEVPLLPEWCDVPNAEHLFLTLKHYPEGWDVGTVTFPCVFMGTQDGKSRWATTDVQYVDNGDGTVTDRKSRLMWEATAKSGGLSLQQAQAYAEGLELGGHTDWRLPTREELDALYGDKVACAWHEETAIRGVMNVWSSEVKEPSSAWVLNVCSGKWRENRSPDISPGSDVSGLAVRFAGK